MVPLDFGMGDRPSPNRGDLEFWWQVKNTVRYMKYTIAAILLCAASILAYQWNRVSRMMDAYARIKIGTPEKAAVEVLGKPDRIKVDRGRMLKMRFDDETHLGEDTEVVMRELVYTVQSQYVGRTIVLGVDANGIVVSRHILD